MGGDNPQPSLPNSAAHAPAQPFNPNLQTAYNTYMPSSYFSSAPQTDPSAILKAYANNIPSFQMGAQSQSSPETTDQWAAEQGKINTQIQNSVNDAMSNKFNNNNLARSFAANRGTLQ